MCERPCKTPRGPRIVYINGNIYLTHVVGDKNNGSILKSNDGEILARIVAFMLHSSNKHLSLYI